MDERRVCHVSSGSSRGRPATRGRPGAGVEPWLVQIRSGGGRPETFLRSPSPLREAERCLGPRAMSPNHQSPITSHRLTHVAAPPAAPPAWRAAPPSSHRSPRVSPCSYGLQCPGGGRTSSVPGIIPSGVESGRGEIPFALTCDRRRRCYSRIPGKGLD